MTPALDLRLFNEHMRGRVLTWANRAGIPVVGRIFIPFTKCDELTNYLKRIYRRYPISFTAREYEMLTETIKKERAAYDNQLKR